MNDTKKYLVNWLLGHLGKEYSEGDSIELTAEDATPYLDCGVISDPDTIENPEGDKDQDKNPLELTAEERESAIEAAIKGLNKENTELFTADGKPTVQAIEMSLDFDITAEERDTAWSALNPEGNGNDE